MLDVEHSGGYDSESCDLHQDRPTQGKLAGVSLVRQTRAKSYSCSARKGKDKGTNKDIEYAEDEKVTLPKVRKLTHSPLPRIVSVNHPTKRENNPTFPSLSNPMKTNFSVFGMAKWDQPPHTKTKLKTIGTKTTATVVRHLDSNCIIHKKIVSDRATRTTVTSPSTAVWDGMVERHIGGSGWMIFQTTGTRRNGGSGGGIVLTTNILVMVHPERAYPLSA